MENQPDVERDVEVVAALVERRGRWLLAKRPADKRHGGRWELPGGKVRAGESLAEAVRRELAEELGVAVTSVGAPGASLRDPGTPFVIRFCPVEIDGEPSAHEHDEVRWVTRDEALALSLAPTDRRFLTSLRAPRAPKAPGAAGFL